MDIDAYTRESNARHWAGIAARATDPRSARINGRAFWLADESAPAPHGFGGDHFRIRFADGRVVDTTNLYSNGDIPAELRTGALCDNATFLDNVGKPSAQAYRLAA